MYENFIQLGGAVPPQCGYNLTEMWVRHGLTPTLSGEATYIAYPLM